MANYEEKTVLMDEATSKERSAELHMKLLREIEELENLVIIGIQTKGVFHGKLIIKKNRRNRGY